MHRRRFLATAALAAAPNILTASKTAEPPVIVGHGTHLYRVENNWSKADHAQVPMVNCHEMIQATDGRLFLLTDHPKNNITPLFPASGPATGSFKGLHPKSKFLAVSQ